MPGLTERRSATSFVCSDCGAQTPRWEGRCPGCGAWNTLAEDIAVAVAGRRSGRAAAPGDVVALDTAAAATEVRLATGIGELDRVLGGGLVRGALVLLGGDPGIGKSTLALELAAHVGRATGRPSLYCAGEESPEQVGMRAVRLGCATASVELVAETDLDTILATIAARRPSVCIVDSVQTLGDPAVAGMPGSVTQVRSAVARLMECAKRLATAIVLVGHVTKDGAIAGPRTLEHMVDVVLYLEGERGGEYRLLRGLKNRFGTTGELGLFEMTGDGLRELDAPGRAVLDETSLGVSGNILTVTCEGGRAVVAEVQALTVPTAFGLPRRAVSGCDIGRLHLLLAVLEKRAALKAGQMDVYLNVVAGVRLAEPAVDLAVALAVAGSATDRRLPEGWAVLGEVGLGGEVRRIRRLEPRLGEAAQVGITDVIVPSGTAAKGVGGVRLHRVGTVSDAVDLLH